MEQFWKNRSRVGRTAIFFDPDILWEEACKYFESVDERAWEKEDWVGGYAKPVTRKYITPYSLAGLCLFLGVGEHYFNDFVNSKTYKEDPDFSEVYARIRHIIVTQQLEGAMTGFFNPAIVARLNGLVDKKDVTSEGHAIAPTVQVVSKQAADDLEKLKDL